MNLDFGYFLQIDRFFFLPLDLELLVPLHFQVSCVASDSSLSEGGCEPSVFPRAVILVGSVTEVQGRLQMHLEGDEHSRSEAEHVVLPNLTNFEDALLFRVCS